MKKNVIAIMLSLVMAVGSVGTVPVFAAEEGSTTEADSEAEETETIIVQENGTYSFSVENDDGEDKSQELEPKVAREESDY